MFDFHCREACIEGITEGRDCISQSWQRNRTKESFLIGTIVNKNLKMNHHVAERRVLINMIDRLLDTSYFTTALVYIKG